MDIKTIITLNINELRILYGLLDERCQKIEKAGVSGNVTPKLREKIAEAIDSNCLEFQHASQKETSL